MMSLAQSTSLNLLAALLHNKPEGKSTGLGLSTINGVMTLNGGRIVISSQVGQGTCV
jgi:signal transduction histidine kinase